MPQLLPPLSESDYQNLRNSIDRDGQRIPVLINTRTGEILDGIHRLRACEELCIEPLIEEIDLDDKEAARLQVTLNVGRRHLSIEQKRELIKTLRDANFSQQEVAEMIGMTQRGVGKAENGSNRTSSIASTPDQRLKITPKDKEEIVKALESGKTQQQAAADYGISRRRVGQIHQQMTAQQERRQQREAAIRDIGELGIQCGDFRQLGQAVPDASVDLILTDPPYDESAIGLYGDLALLAARVLRPGGWCLAYSGHTWFPQALQEMSRHLAYGWVFAIQHTGGDTRYRKLKLQHKWKPILGFYRPPLDVWWDWFPDLVSGGKEKLDHEWQQAVAEAIHYIQALCPPGGVVLDPMVGSGTTCLAAMQTGRQWIAFDQDLEAVHIARSRMAEGTGDHT